MPKGALKKRHGMFNYWLVVPDGYDPAKKYQVRFQLHGGVMREDSTLRGDGAVRLAGAEQIYISPAGWTEAPWWSDQQVASLRAILDDVKRDYNVDENRVVVSGVSDGGTGAYYVAMRDTTPYASFLPLNGYVLVLRSPELEIRGDLFLNNLRNKPFFIVNGGKDPLYPIDAVEPSLVHMNAGGVRMVYRPQPDAGHDTSWWPALKDDFEKLRADAPSRPAPRQADLGGLGDAHLEPRALADHRQARRDAERREGSRRSEPVRRPGHFPQRPLRARGPVARGQHRDRRRPAT